MQGYAELQERGMTFQNTCVQGACQVVVRMRGIIITQKQTHSFTVILSFLDKTIFLKLHSVFCTRVSLKPFTKRKLFSWSRTEPFTYSP